MTPAIETIMIANRATVGEWTPALHIQYASEPTEAVATIPRNSADATEAHFFTTRRKTEHCDPAEVHVPAAHMLTVAALSALFHARKSMLSFAQEVTIHGRANGMALPMSKRLHKV